MVVGMPDGVVVEDREATVIDVKLAKPRYLSVVEGVLVEVWQAPPVPYVDVLTSVP
jgi:hypothetical protein